MQDWIRKNKIVENPEIWTTATGDKIAILEMAESHLKNSINLLRRKNSKSALLEILEGALYFKITGSRNLYDMAVKNFKDIIDTAWKSSIEYSIKKTLEKHHGSDSDYEEEDEPYSMF
jgi:hypothetical protein